MDHKYDDKYGVNMMMMMMVNDDDDGGGRCSYMNDHLL